MDLQVSDKVALITGASTGLGFAVARTLADEGANVVIGSRSQERISAAATTIGERALGVAADVTSPDSAERLVNAALDRFGRIDMLVTNAGGPPVGNFESVTLAQWEAGVELTLMSTVRLIKAALPYLKQSDSGSILTITSISVKQPVDNLLLSNVIRPAVIGLTKSLARELGGYGIRVNSILPGYTATDRTTYLFESRAAASGRTVEEQMALATRDIPLGRMGTPAEFANVAAFLLSPRASYVTGEMVLVDGAHYRGLM